MTKISNQNLVDIILKADESVKKTKKYHLILKIAVPGTKSGIPFIIFTNFYLIISAGQV